MLIYSIIILSQAKYLCKGGIYLMQDILCAFCYKAPVVPALIFLVVSVIVIVWPTRCELKHNSRLPRWLFAGAVVFLVTVIWQELEWPLLPVCMTIRLIDCCVISLLAEFMLIKSKRLLSSLVFVCMLFIALGNCLGIIIEACIR